VSSVDDGSTSLDRVRPFDAALLGLEVHPDDPTAFSLVVEPSLCRVDGRFYGGAALSASLVASEAVSGRPALWSSTQLVGVADLGERIRVDVDVVAAGRTIDQVQVRGTVDERLIFSAVGAAATPRPDGMAGVGQTMPRVAPPEDCEPWAVSAAGAARAALDPDAPRIGHHLLTEQREAPLLDAEAQRPGRFALWTRFTGDLGGTPLTPAALGFVADLVPLAAARACGVDGVGTSLDNSLRVGEAADDEWVLVDVDAHVAVGGFGHGDVHLGSPDGRLLGIGSQSARLFSLEDFFRKHMPASDGG